MSEKELFEKAEQLVRTSVLVPMTCIMDELFERGVIEYDDLENSHHRVCAECGEQLDNDFEDGEENEDGFIPCPFCKQDAREDSEPSEILEWWAVDNWLAARLREEGEPIIPLPDFKVWGRCTSGQAIALDGVIQKIANR